jgi:type II secretory pathway pseudopilin PulG
VSSGKDASGRRRRPRHAGGDREAPAPGSAAAAGAARGAAARRAADEPGPASDPREDRPAPDRASAAALVAVLLFGWGLSLLAFDAARRELFEPQGRDHVVLAVPIFAGAALAGLLAHLMRRLGRRPVGGAAVHRFGLAAGLLGVSAMALALSLGPSVQRAERESRALRAERLLEGLALALERHRAEAGHYPAVVGMQSLGAALIPAYLQGPPPVTDPWGHPLWYQAFDGGAAYLLLSLGPDGTQTLPAFAYLDAPSPPDCGDDVVVVSGRFVSLGGFP